MGLKAIGVRLHAGQFERRMLQQANMQFAPDAIKKRRK